MCRREKQYLERAYIYDTDVLSTTREIGVVCVCMGRWGGGGGGGGVLLTCSQLRAFKTVLLHLIVQHIFINHHT